MSIKVIGAGFGRTGTTSLKVALEQLGFSKCYHMFEVIHSPEDAALWQSALEHKTTGEPTDWSVPFKGYKATLDWPGCTFYQELMATYPDAKVLLTTRDPESWYASAEATIYQSNQMEEETLPPPMQPFIKMVKALLWEHTFDGKFEDKAYAIDVFNAHNEEVKRIVPSEKLLVYNVKEGWEPLGEFLGVETPKGEPFPHLNDRQSFKERVIKMIQEPREQQTAG